MADHSILGILKRIPESKNWTKGDTARASANLLGVLADWGQTRFIAQKDKRKHGFYEATPITRQIIGKNPSVQAVDAFFLLSGLGGLLLERKLPPKIRRLYQTLTLGNRLSVIANNDRIGIGFGAKF